MHSLIACLLLFAAPPVDWDVVGRRDGLVKTGDPALFGSGERRIAAVRVAELDGAPPAERLVHVQEYVGEGAWTDELHAYRAGRRLGAPWVWGGYRDPGWWRARDFDGDGRDEVLVVGDTAGDSASQTVLLRWTGQGFEDRMWSLEPGVGVVPLPPEIAGEWLLLGFDRLWNHPKGGDRRCLGLREGYWRAVPCPVPADGTAALQAILEDGGLPRPIYTARGLAHWLRDAGAWPAPDALLPEVMAAFERGGDWAVFDLLAWPEGPATAATLSGWLEQPIRDNGVTALAPVVAATGDRGHRERVLEISAQWVRRQVGFSDWFVQHLVAQLTQRFDDVGEGWRVRRWAADLPPVGLPPGARAVGPDDPMFRRVPLDAVRAPGEIRRLVEAAPDLAAVVKRARALAAAGPDQAPWLRAVGGVDHPDAQAWREAMLVSGSPAERIAVAETWPVTAPAEPVALALAGERAEAARQALAGALARVGGPVAHKALLASIAEGGSLLTLQALYSALVQAKAPPAALKSVLRASDCTVRPMLVELLGRERSPETGPALEDLQRLCPKAFEATLLAVLGEAAIPVGAAGPWARALAAQHQDHPKRSVRRLAARVLLPRPPEE